MANADPAAVIGVDEDHVVPALIGEYAHIPAYESAEMQATAQVRANNINNNNLMNVNDTNVDDVKIIVLDGIVMAPMVNNTNKICININANFYL